MPGRNAALREQKILPGNFWNITKRCGVLRSSPPLGHHHAGDQVLDPGLASFCISHARRCPEPAARQCPAHGLTALLGSGAHWKLISPPLPPSGPSKAWLPIKKNKNPQSKARPFASPWCMFTHANQPGTVLPFFQGLQDSEYPLQPLGATCRGSSAGAPCACPVGGRFQLQPNASSNSTTSTPLPSVYFGWGFMVRGATRIGDISHLPGPRGPSVLFVIPSTHSSCFGHREGPDRRI